MRKMGGYAVVAFAALAVLVSASQCFAARKKAESFETKDKAYFTRVNIWYEEPERIFITNYHIGSIIPAGTQVKIVASSDKAIKFTKAGADTVYALVFVAKHSAKPMKELFAQYFSETNELNTGLFSKFSGKEKEAIKKGVVEPGMSKEAVLVAFGYPPTHRTPSLSDDTWIFWRNRYVQTVVTFKNNKVVEVGH